MAADIILLNQYYLTSRDHPEGIPAMLPINLLYLASFLKRAGMDCRVVELGFIEAQPPHPDGNRLRYGLTDREIEEILRSQNPRLVGIGCMYTRHYPEVIEIAELVKRTCPQAKTVLGGNHASSFPLQILKNEAVDFVVVGEGERTLHALSERVLNGNAGWSEVDGLAYRDNNGRPRLNRKRELIEDISELEVDYELVDVERYTAQSRHAPFLMRPPTIGVVTSRGCPNKCVYCTVKNVYGRTWRGKSARKTVDELEFLRKRYGLQEFSILDDSASLDKKRWNEICDEIIVRKLDIRWTTPNGIAHWTLDEATLDKMKKAGCYRVTFGIESGYEETRRYLGKPYALAQALDMIRHANKIGMWTICTNIIGFPYEPRESMDATIRFAKTSGTDFATFYLLWPHVASEVYGDFRKEGLLDFDRFFDSGKVDWEEYEKMIRTVEDDGAPTKYFSPEELRAIQIKGYRSFFLWRFLSYLINPPHLMRKVRSIEDFRYLSRLLFVGLSIVARSLRARTTGSLLRGGAVRD